MSRLSKRKMPPLNPKPTRQWPRYQQGERMDDPIRVGGEDPSVLFYVEASGMAGGIRSGHRRWVTGDGVGHLIATGSFIVVEAPEPPPVIERGPIEPVSQPQPDRTPTQFCKDCTATWKVGARVECTCTPIDEGQWVTL